MKKVLTLAAFAVLTSTSLGQALKFDPLTGTPEEYGNKAKSLTIKLSDPNLSLILCEAIEHQLKGLRKLTRYKFRLGQINGEELFAMVKAYRNYGIGKLAKFGEKVNEKNLDRVKNSRFYISSYIEDLIRAQYDLNGRDMDEPDKNLKALIQRLNKIQDAENESAVKEGRNPTNYLSLLKGPLGLMKIDRAIFATASALLKDLILDFPEDRVTKALTEAEAKFNELQPAFQALKSAFMQIQLTADEKEVLTKGEDEDPLYRTASIINEFQQIPLLYPVIQISTDKVRIEGQGIIFSEGIIVTEPDDKLTPVSFFLKPCKAEDIFRLLPVRGLTLKTASGTGNSSYKSDPISVNDLTDITLRYKVKLELDEGGIGFGFQSGGKWIVQKSYSYIERNEGVVEDEIKLPPIKGDITLVISNSRAKAARSRIEFDLLELTAKRKKE